MYSMLLIFEVKGYVKWQRCAFSHALRTHREWFKNQPNFEYYLPDLSCGLCSNPLCDFVKDDKCNKTSQLSFIPLYENIFEVGFFGTFFPRMVIISITFSKKCYHKVKITKVLFRGKQKVYFSMEECFRSNDECYRTFYRTAITFQDLERECFFFAIGYHAPKKVNIDYSTTCYHVPTSNFSNSHKTNFEIFQDECKWEKGFESSLCYKFMQYENSEYKGVPFIVPCSTAGYAVDVRTGRFLVNKKCKRIFHENTSNEVGLDYIIKEYFDGNEHLKFPHIGGETLSPIYDTGFGNVPHSRERMKSFTETIKEIINLHREKCDFYDENRNRTTTTTTTTASSVTEKSVTTVVSKTITTKTTTKATLKPFDRKSAINKDENLELVQIANEEDRPFPDQNPDIKLDAKNFDDGACPKNGSSGSGGAGDTSSSSVMKISTKCITAGIFSSILFKFCLL
ncbi:UNVERIFIED_CONTAM: hypothetical protein RMT77_013786 [Armadillidium vulgare]